MHAWMKGGRMDQGMDAGDQRPEIKLCTKAKKNGIKKKLQKHLTAIF